MDVGQALGLIETPGGDPLEVAAACERLKAQGVGGCPPAGSHSSAVRRRAGRFDPLGQLVDAVPRRDRYLLVVVALERVSVSSWLCK